MKPSCSKAGDDVVGGGVGGGGGIGASLKSPKHKMEGQQPSANQQPVNSGVSGPQPPGVKVIKRRAARKLYRKFFKSLSINYRTLHNHL